MNEDLTGPIAPQQPSLEINLQNSTLGGGMPFGIAPDSIGDLFSGMPYRPAKTVNMADSSSWFDQNYSDPQGNPAHIGGAPPAFSERGNPYGLPTIFSQGAPPSGVFTLNDYYKQAQGGTQGDLYGGQVPAQFSAGSSLPSTNDWRQLPPQYRNPNYFMINGQIIDRRQADSDIHGHGVLGQEAGQGDPGFGVSHGTGGYPFVQMAGGLGQYFGQLGGGASLWGMGGA